MTNRSTLEIVNRTLKQLRRNDCTMGGVLFVLCGDFRQILPVVPRGTRADVVAACIKSSPLWREVEVHHLRRNMRLLQGEEAFAEVLLAIGEGRFPAQESVISVPPEIRSETLDWKEFVAELPLDDQSAILTPLNSKVEEINTFLLDRWNGEEHTYFSFHSVPNEDDLTNFPIDFLQTVVSSGIPSHQLKLKRGCPVSIMRNLEPPVLCNGTRCRVVEMRRNLIEVEVAVGPYSGVRRLITRIPFVPIASEFPVSFRRIQFPLRLCFAMTLNRSQGQTFQAVRVILSPSVFSHGMLYVALSRCVSKNSLKVLCRADGKTSNIVYQEVL